HPDDVPPRALKIDRKHPRAAADLQHSSSWLRKGLEQRDKRACGTKTLVLDRFTSVLEVHPVDTVVRGRVESLPIFLGCAEHLSCKPSLLTNAFLVAGHH